MNHDLALLLHIKDAIEELQVYLTEGRKCFDKSLRTRLAAERLLSIIGEAANKLSPEITASQPEIPWRRISGLRNIIIHEYFKVDPDLIWGIMDQSLSQLNQAVTTMLVGTGSE